MTRHRKFLLVVFFYLTTLALAHGVSPLLESRDVAQTGKVQARPQLITRALSEKQRRKLEDQYWNAKRVIDKAPAEIKAWEEKRRKAYSNRLRAKTVGLKAGYTEEANSYTSRINSKKAAVVNAEKDKEAALRALQG